MNHSFFGRISFGLFALLVFSFFVSCSTDEDDNGDGGGGGGGGNVENQFVSCGGYDYIEDVPERTYEGVICISDLVVDENNADLTYEKIEYKYYFSTLIGEALHRGSIRWNGNIGANEINLITIRAKVYHLNGDFTGYYYFYKPIFGDIENDWSIDISGSPAWNKLFTTNAAGTNFLAEQETKDLFVSGFYLADLYPFSLNDQTYNFN